MCGYVFTQLCPWRTWHRHNQCKSDLSFPLCFLDPRQTQYISCGSLVYLSCFFWMPFFPKGWDLLDMCVRSMCFLKSPQKIIWNCEDLLHLLSIPKHLHYDQTGDMSACQLVLFNYFFCKPPISLKIFLREFVFLLLYFCFGRWQKWHCVEEITGKWRIQKCKGGSKEGSRKRARSLKPRSSYDNRERGCDCGETLYKPSRAERRSHRQLSSSSGHREFTWTCCHLLLLLYATWTTYNYKE